MKRIPENLEHEITDGKESIRIEFKAAQGRDGQGQIPKDVYETVCAFSNRDGGNIYLGVDDTGNVLGLSDVNLTKMTKEFITTIQSGNKLMPALYLDIAPYWIDDKIILHIYVPNSSQVHRMNGRIIFDRHGDADIDITNNTNLVQQMYARKQVEYTENKIYPYVEITDFRADLTDFVRKSSTNVKGEHNLANQSDLQVLKSLSMYKKDYANGIAGFTLASILLFGKDDVIRSVLPYFALDIVVKIKDVDRYDDRLRISTNLIDSYSQMMAFIAKHINQPFYLRQDKRIEIRDVLFRELIVNMLVHREYSNPFVSRITITATSIQFENANKPMHPGKIRRGDIWPYPKNPNIARVFHLIGLVEELGSGVSKIFEFAPILLGAEPLIDNEDQFTVKLPITPERLNNLSNAQHFFIDNGHNLNADNMLQTKKVEIDPFIPNYQSKIITYLSEHDSIDRSTVETLLNVKQAQAIRYLKQLISANILRKVGGGPSTRYVLIQR
ncbi:RNA-binding domain-containing protein [Loigolactobacillus bifermentans]|uniref:Schlafen AlbA-2 domain-containing protein n=1 Tax=Loigolactobacillus bifermentans DSM 20003 TaxID=1423726 RepID=A0A0R1GH03_9LACO|nr:RNA-binding domain-containing protein [Loigolactobacillus bifermentans]KRK33161.1 hypothetical protein FC07_GL001416 [Loigolactobacillus bifermentans DSM 20003]